MKTMILMTAIMLGSISYAQTTQIKGSEMIQEMNENGLYGGSLEGEVEDLGSACTVAVKDSAKGNKALVFTSESGLTLKLEIAADAKVNRQFKGDEDYSVTYKFDGFKTVEFIHASDAYDMVSVSTGTTTLTCSAYY